MEGADRGAATTTCSGPGGDIEAEATARRKKNGIKPLGPPAILTQDPHRQPARSKKSPAPAFHAASQAVRRQLREAYALFVAAYREAAEKLRAGNRNACFPSGASSCVAIRGRVDRRRGVFDLTTVLYWRPVSGDWERGVSSRALQARIQEVGIACFNPDPAWGESETARMKPEELQEVSYRWEKGDKTCLLRFFDLC